MKISPETAALQDELLRRLKLLVAIDSARGPAEAGAPFGRGPRQALDAALGMLEADGIRTVDLDHMAGYGEIGQGDEVIGIICHLDCVPADRSQGWQTDPFVLSEKDGILTGRGVADDKGAAVAAMLALKVLQEQHVPLNRRVRLIFGTNEESGSRGLRHYVEQEGGVDYGFTPDGNFPGIFGEKGTLKGVYHSRRTQILNLSGGMAPNVVCPRCTAEILPHSCSRSRLKNYFADHSVACEIEELTDRDRITVTGRAAHASMPELGVNAITFLLMGLKESGFQDPFTEFYASHFGYTIDGSGLGARCSDEYGVLTCCNGMIGMQDGVITGTFDIRFPVTMSSRQIRRQMEGHLEDENGWAEIQQAREPLYYPVDSPLVRSLHQAYVEVTGDHENLPATMGGGTYAKVIANTIAFGCCFPGRNYHLHEANEQCPREELLEQTEIYVQAVKNLLAL